MNDHREDREDSDQAIKPVSPQAGDDETPPHPSPAEGGDTEAAERPPRPSQAEGERSPG